MKAQQISNVISPLQSNVALPEEEIRYLLTDSRRLVEPQGTLFFAIPTARNTGARYIDDLYRLGVRSFIVPQGCMVKHNDANVWRVDNVVEALQRVASAHRQQYHIPVVGITGSNGKTVVKDWLVQLLSSDRRVVANPKSYNSQIGVPLSVWQMSGEHEIALFEAGISQPGEMEALAQVIQPTIGLLTNIGAAHDENFISREQKLAEKQKLFAGCEVVVCNERYHFPNAYTWGAAADCQVRLLKTEVGEDDTRLTVASKGEESVVTIPFVDRASQENIMHCIALMSLLGYRLDTIAERCAHLAPVEMRMEMGDGLNNCLLINDSYSLDLGSLAIALDTLAHQHEHPRRTLVMSDIPQSGMDESDLYGQVAHLLRQRGVQRIVGIGPALMRHQELFADIDSACYLTTDDFLARHDMRTFHNETILLKGARAYGFERIAKLLQRKSHETVMEVNLDALVHNLNYYRSRLNPGTKLMAMVKASSYGAGMVEVATALQFNHVVYLTVAYIDEGVELRRGGITLPIMVMNPEPAGFDDILRYRLEPDIYSFRILDLFASCVEENGMSDFPIHVEFDTGMHRLGFCGADVPMLQERLAKWGRAVKVKSVFSHLACSEDPEMDDFTRRQISRLREWSAGLPGIKHILNSSGITRFPEAQMDMVRLGIGLYGVAPEPEVQRQLRQVSRLVSRISQIKEIPAGDTVGYNCRWKASRPSRIAIITIGYADGLHRGLGNGNGHVLIGNAEAPIIGSICMDMCFVDVTGIPCQEGDRAILFGEGDLLERNAAAAGTIPYELLTAVAPRVKRIYYHQE